MGCRTCKRTDVAHNARTCTSPIPGSNLESDKLFAFANDIKALVILPQIPHGAIVHPESRIRWKGLRLILDEAKRLRKAGK